ncbi:MAG TPA: sulfur carrier protein ThiS [Chitinispirillaceae bacterium]|nr:sulfur carrier protein ThiS [Chitinispirillaceae bacterium]
MVTIVLNGKIDELQTSVLISEYLAQKSINPDHVVVEINRTIINKNDFCSMKIVEGDNIEILRFVGGG